MQMCIALAVEAWSPLQCLSMQTEEAGYLLPCQLTLVIDGAGCAVLSTPQWHCNTWFRNYT
jgi:hypothetical protein